MRILITGTSSGFGKSLHKYYSKNHEVVSLNRPEYDFKDLSFLTKVNDKLDYDIVIINAGTRERRENNNWSTVFDVNFTNQVHLVEKIKDNIRSKLVFMSSRSSSMHNLKLRSLDRFEFETLAYKASKAAINIAMLHYSKKLDIPVVAITPGHLSDTIRHSDSTVPNDVITDQLTKFIDSVSIKHTGKLYNYDGSERPF